MRVMQRVLAALVVSASATQAKAVLVLDYVDVGSINAALSNGPALTSLTMAPGEVRFIQVALRDTTGSTVAWSVNGNDASPAGPGSQGLGAFFVRFDSIPGIAVNPLPTVSTNARLVDTTSYLTVTAGTSPPTFTRIGGLINFGSEPGAVPNAAFQNRIGLFNLRINALADGNGNFILRDPNPAPSSMDNATLLDADLGGAPNPGTLQSIDNLLTR